MSIQKPTFVLVHGAWHHFSCWKFVQEELEKLGYDSVAVDLPSPGSVPPLSSNEKDIAAVRKELQKLIDEGKDVVLVMHSYGGYIGGGSAEGLEKRTLEAQGLKGGVVAGIFCAAFLTPVGSTLVESFPAQPECMKTVPDDPAYIYIEDPKEHMYNDVEQSVADVWIAKLRLHPFASCFTPAKYSIWTSGVPCAYLICDNDTTFLPPWQESMIKTTEEASGVKFKVGRVNASHSFWLSKPVESVEFFDEVIKSL